MVYPWKSQSQQKTPEINEYNRDKKYMKIWAHNFEKQKSYISLRFFFRVKKKDHGKCSNFFVFQSYVLRFSEIFCPYLKRPFPGSFVFGHISGGVPITYSKSFKKIQNKTLHLLELVVGIPSRDEPRHGMSPGNERTRTRQKILKIWAHNFEKQKS